jgi:hypothetical protein
MKNEPSRGSHLPVLMKVVRMTQGPILELGCGMYSTQYLHWECFATKRELWTYENNPDYYDYIKKFETDYHRVCEVVDWRKVDFGQMKPSVVFVDFSPEEQRYEVIPQFKDADYIVCHDSENRRDHKLKLSKILNLFKYRWKFDEAYPHTSLWSNKYDLKYFTTRG